MTTDAVKIRQIVRDCGITIWDSYNDKRKNGLRRVKIVTKLPITYEQAVTVDHQVRAAGIAVTKLEFVPNFWSQQAGKSHRDICVTFKD